MRWRERTSTYKMITDMDLELSSELAPPPEPKRRDKKWRKHPRPGALTKRGPPRPYKRLPEEVLNSRIKKLTSRVETAKQKVISTNFSFSCISSS